jgi:preprotein translocase subunit SecF
MSKINLGSQSVEAKDVKSVGLRGTTLQINLNDGESLSVDMYTDGAANATLAKLQEAAAANSSGEEETKAPAKTAKEIKAEAKAKKEAEEAAAAQAQADADAKADAEDADAKSDSADDSKSEE